mmetsp:Transcript_25557/g.46999  ORF Transcript_25557/g.46999 Transcript_25557/m.46999 type:complete len:466 (+) Transcript_25557:109-1506(+)
MLLVLIAAILCSFVALLVCAVFYAVKKHSKPHHVETAYLRSMDVSEGSLFSIFQPHLVPMEVIRSRGYSSVLSIVQHMIGVQPTCDGVLEIWPPAFECYNIIVPNFLNFPEVLFGAPGAVDSKLMSLAMYASSRANECAYCSSHCCSFAVRRGVDPTVLRNLLDEMNNEENSPMSPEESNTAKLAYGLGTVPCSLNVETVKESNKLFTPAQLEWLMAATAVFGALNKLMDGLNIPLELSTYQETVDHLGANYKAGAASGMLQVEPIAKMQRKPTPQIDDWTNYVAIIYHGLRPGGAMSLDRKLLQGIPAKITECCAYLNTLCGCSFKSVLESLQHERFRRAITCVISKNFVSDNLSLHLKVRVGLQYCDVLENSILAEELKKVLASAAVAYQDDQNHDNAIASLVLQVGNALSYAPSRMTPRLVNQIRASDDFTPVMIVELVSFLAILQMLHRIISFHIVNVTSA